MISPLQRRGAGNVVLHKEVVVETLDAHIAKCFDTNATADRFSKRLMIPSSFMAGSGSFVKCMTNTTIYKKKYIIALVSKELVAPVEASHDVI